MSATTLEWTKTEMTDYEITNHCAEALGLGYTRPVEENPRAVEYNEDPEESAWMLFCPLDDDHDAMQLVKAKNLSCQFFDEDGWRGWLVGNKPWQEAFWVKNEELNRAIVECVAHMQKGKMNG